MMLTEFKNLAVFDIFRLDNALWIRYNTSIDKKVPNCKAYNDLGMAGGGEWRRVENDKIVELVKSKDFIDDT